MDKITIIYCFNRLIINFRRSVLLNAMNDANVESKCGTESRGDMALCKWNEKRYYNYSIYDNLDGTWTSTEKFH